MVTEQLNTTIWWYAPGVIILLILLSFMQGQRVL